MKLKDFVATMQKIAPPELAMSFDNCGLLISPENREITRVLVALDCTVQVAEEAESFGAQLVLAHHPLMFSPIKHVLDDDPNSAAVYALVRRGIGMYAAHTTLDAARGGVSDVLCATLGLSEVVPIPGAELGRIGELDRCYTLEELARYVSAALDSYSLVTGDLSAVVRRVAVVGGQGADFLGEAARAGADVFVTGEVRHHEAIGAGVLGIPAIAAGHYETERVVLPALIKRLQRVDSGIQYRVAHCEGPSLRMVT